MTDAKHLSEVPATGPTFAEAAGQSDQLVRIAMESAADAFPGRQAAILAGATAALVRMQFGSMPRASAQQVLEVMAPQIRNIAQQLVVSRAGATGQSIPANADQPLQLTAFNALQRHLTEAPLATFAVLMQDKVVLLLSVNFSDKGIQSHCSLPGLPAAVAQPVAVIREHCKQAMDAWAERPPTNDQAVADLITAAQHLSKALEASATVDKVMKLPLEFRKALAEVVAFGHAANSSQAVV